MKCTFVLFVMLWGVISNGSAFAKTYHGTPQNYLTFCTQLQAGDTLALAPGTYTGGLALKNLHGTPAGWIVIRAVRRYTAVLIGRECCNTIDLRNCSYIRIDGLKLDGQNFPNIDAIKAGGGAQDYTHHVWIESNLIVGHGNNQQTVGISTKITSWDWTIRRNTIIEAGTGIYLGNSDGGAPFIRGVIEYNLILHPIGYCMQIKHQNQRPLLSGLPTENATTIIRHNVFAKDDRPSPDGNRPNLFVGGPPLSGAGSSDRAEIYGNFFYHNPRESFLQGTGNLSIHNNIFVDGAQAAIRIQPHENRRPLCVRVYCNTIYAVTTGVSISGITSTVPVTVRGNAIFSPHPLTGTAPDRNLVGAVAQAAAYFNTPTTELATMDFYPKNGAPAAKLDLTPFKTDWAWNLDFNGMPQDGDFHGAYNGKGVNPGWKLALEQK